MAKSKANKDKEEEGASNAPQDDDDFGLPELEYEALDDDEEDDSSMDDSEVYSSPSFDESDSSFLVEDDDDSKVSSIFDVEDSDQDDMSNVFGEGDSAGKEEMYSEPKASGGGDPKSFTRIIILGAVSFVVIGFAFLYWHHKDDDKKTVAKVAPKEQKNEPKPLAAKGEPAAKEEEPAKKEEPVKKEPAVTKEPVKEKAEVVQTVGTPGEVLVISEKTGRSYVIVGSFFDGDLADDFGRKLAGEGLNAKVIKPFGKSRFFRVSIADFESYKEAADEAEKAKATYGAEVWAYRF